MISIAARMVYVIHGVRTVGSSSLRGITSLSARKWRLHRRKLAAAQTATAAPWSRTEDWDCEVLRALRTKARIHPQDHVHRGLRCVSEIAIQQVCFARLKIDEQSPLRTLTGNRYKNSNRSLEKISRPAASLNALQHIIQRDAMLQTAKRQLVLTLALIRKSERRETWLYSRLQRHEGVIVGDHVDLGSADRVLHPR